MIPSWFFRSIFKTMFFSGVMIVIITMTNLTSKDYIGSARDYIWTTSWSTSYNAIPLSVLEWTMSTINTLLFISYILFLVLYMFRTRDMVPRNRTPIRTLRVVFLVALAGFICTLPAYYSMTRASYGSGKANIVKNSFRFVKDHPYLAGSFIAGLSEKEKGLVESSVEKYASPPAFAVSNFKETHGGNGKNKKAEMTSGLSPAGTAVVTAATRICRNLNSLNALFLFIMAMVLVNLYIVGWRAWKIANAEEMYESWWNRLLYHVLHVPMAILLGYFWMPDRVYGMTAPREMSLEEIEANMQMATEEAMARMDERIEQLRRGQ